MRFVKAMTLFSVLILLSAPSGAQKVSDEWRFRISPPQEGWSEFQFDDSHWKEGAGGFGTRGTVGARVGTEWSSNNIWLRKSFELTEVPANPALLINHDEDAEVYINGKAVAEFDGYTTDYKVVSLSATDRDVLRTGRNVLAVHCSQKIGGQFIDVHVIDADNVPKLPKPKGNTKPFISELITKWGEDVTPENAWTEYPRPQMVRDNWTNLNGQWDYAITPIDQHVAPSKWNGQILVPYCLESKLGGVQRLLDETEALWYSRTFEANTRENNRLMLNFEAVDYRCEVFVNGTSVGTHVGGNTPFAFDITEALKQGKNELLVRVEDATGGYQLLGKQTTNPRAIWYTRVSGIWQTVWLEEVHASYLEDVKISTNAKSNSITVKPIKSGSGNVHVVVKDGNTVVAEEKGAGELTLTVPNAKLWSPDSPFLYDIEITLNDHTGKRLDRVQSYAGIRTVGKAKDADGHLRFTLNGDVIFHLGPLDQGWWPDGLLTPPSDEAMLFDIEWLKQAGFNMIRKHIKVESRRYYYHCDRVGMMVWQDQPNSREGSPKWTRVNPDPADGVWPFAQHEQYMLELESMIDALENHPSIVCWIPFNEAWGQHQSMYVGLWTVGRDPSRLVNISSGGNFWPIGDIVDHHHYTHPKFPFEQGANGRFDDFVKVIGEFGGHGYPVKGHLWDAKTEKNWGYGGLPKNEDEYKERYVTSIKKLDDLRHAGISAGVYTQTTDVEGEINGLMTYDRKVSKIPADELAKLHKLLFMPRDE